MTRDEKKLWMFDWCTRNQVHLDLNGEVGFGRECVGIFKHDSFVDYEWDDTYECEQCEDYPLVKEEYVWTPKDAYHKHTCVAVLGLGEDAEDQLYEWLKWFDENGFVIETHVRSFKNEISLLLKGPLICRIVKGGKQ